MVILGTTPITGKNTHTPRLTTLQGVGWTDLFPDYSVCREWDELIGLKDPQYPDKVQFLRSSAGGAIDNSAEESPQEWQLQGSWNNTNQNDDCREY